MPRQWVHTAGTGHRSTPPIDPIVRTAVASDESISYAVVHAVAAVGNDHVLDIPPLYGTIDVDALETLLASTSSPASVTFAYDEYYVRVDDEGTVAVFDVDPRG